MLQENDSLDERTQILPFFRSNSDISCALGTYVSGLIPDLLAHEYDLFGDFVCDLVIGDSHSKSFLFVEFEDAKPQSLFVKRPGKVTPDWAPRVEHGLSQVIDWFWKLADSEKSDDYEYRFGTRHANVHGMVIIGRDQNLTEREKRRLEWRQRHTLVHSSKLMIVTFDQLVRDLRYRVQRFPGADQLRRGATT